MKYPYRIYGGLSFYQRKEIKDLLAYFRPIINHNDEEALFCIINFPARGIGKTSQQKISIKAQEHDVTAWKSSTILISMALSWALPWLHACISSKP
ncbi:MAG: 3'-5' exonuclease [Bacteroidales bacterium]|nr:3'-5' exonuclease [Bacteroidales bacterium]